MLPQLRRRVRVQHGTIHMLRNGLGEVVATHSPHKPHALQLCSGHGPSFCIRCSTKLLAAGVVFAEIDWTLATSHLSAVMPGCRLLLCRWAEYTDAGDRLGGACQGVVTVSRRKTGEASPGRTPPAGIDSRQNIPGRWFDRCRHLGKLVARARRARSRSLIRAIQRGPIARPMSSRLSGLRVLRRHCSSGSDGNGGGRSAAYSAGAGVFACLAILQAKRLYEERTGNDYGLSALLNGRWGKPRLSPRDPDS